MFPQWLFSPWSLVRSCNRKWKLLQWHRDGHEEEGSIRFFSSSVVGLPALASQQNAPLLLSTGNGVYKLVYCGRVSFQLVHGLTLAASRLMVIHSVTDSFSTICNNTLGVRPPAQCINCIKPKSGGLFLASCLEFPPLCPFGHVVSFKTIWNTWHQIVFSTLKITCGHKIFSGNWPQRSVGLK